MATSIDETFAEEDPFLAGDMEVHENQNTNSFEMYWMICGTILNLILYLAGIAADIFFSVIVCKFQNLKTRSNYCIMYYLLFHIMFLIFNVLHFASLLISTLPSYMFCTLGRIQFTVVLVQLLLVIGLLVDWVFVTYIPQVVEKCRYIYKYGLAVLYIFALLQLVVTSIVICPMIGDHFFKHLFHTYVSAFSLECVYIFLFVFVVIVNIIKICKKDESKASYVITVVNIITISWLCLVVYANFIQIAYFIYIPMAIVLGHPILILYMLGRTNKYFKMAYSKIFKRSLRVYHDDNLDGVSECDSSPSQNLNGIFTAQKHDLAA